MPILFGIHSDVETWESREQATRYVAFEVAGLDQGYKTLRASCQYELTLEHPAGVLRVYLLDSATPLFIYNAVGELVGTVNAPGEEGAA